MSSANNAIAIWLSWVCAVIFCMIVVGGVTRLTHSGLSMVDWQPIMGVIPPLNAADWDAAFDAYKQFPEYQKVNQDMTVAEFRSIYYWEYGHRLLGRLIGIVFLIPFIVLLYQKRIQSPMLGRLTIALILGGLQGLLGWYMVKSGLVDMPRVSHFRLAAHLSLAMFLMAYLFWLILDLREVRRLRVGRGMGALTYLLAVTLTLQVIYGAFVAGLRAGLGFNTFPLMDGRLLAEAATMMSPYWLNLFENGAMIQFVHRWLGALLLVIVLVGLATAIRERVSRPIVAGWSLVVVVTIVQFVLGVTTLLMYVPVVIASIHQSGAVVTMLAVVYLLYISRGSADR